MNVITDIDGRLVHPQVKDLYTRMREVGAPGYRELGLARARAMVDESARLQAQPGSIDRVEDVVATTRSGTVSVRIYRPSRPHPQGVLVFLHGGGWATGSVAGVDPLCRDLCSTSGRVVASVEYRRTPEVRWPQNLHDVLDSLAWLTAEQANLGLEHRSWIIGGDSAGAYLAACTAQETSRRLAGQMLLYPVVSPNCDTTSYQENGLDPALKADDMQWFWEQLTDGTAPPNLAALAASPDWDPIPTFVLTCGLDVLRDEGLTLARAAALSGSDLTAVHLAGVPHGLLSLSRFLSEPAARARTAIDEWLARH